MKTLDLKKQYKSYYQPKPGRVELVDVPALPFLMIDGEIETGKAPGTSPGFAGATQAMYTTAYTLKFMLKQRPVEAVDYPVMALEGLWWVEDGLFDLRKPDNWHYTLMILQPDLVTQTLLAEAREKIQKKKDSPAAVEQVRLEVFHEGLCVQALHVGPYATEPETMEQMQAFLSQNQLVDQVGLGGKHHEIYLGDPRKATPEKLKTVLRHPVAAA